MLLGWDKDPAAKYVTQTTDASGAFAIAFAMQNCGVGTNWELAIWKKLPGPASAFAMKNCGVGTDWELAIWKKLLGLQARSIMEHCWKNLSKATLQEVCLQRKRRVGLTLHSIYIPDHTSSVKCQCCMVVPVQGHALK